jgi:hypothetical protein
VTRINRPLIFVTGAPRSGTSMMAKVIDAHPRVALLMENPFGLRRRLCQEAACWQSDEALAAEVAAVYDRLPEPVVGNKVVTPDAWDAADIARFCGLFSEARIVYMVRDPREVLASRWRREPADFLEIFSHEARERLPLDFTSRSHTYASSWRRSLDNYRALRDAFPGAVRLVYYEDFCADFANQSRELQAFLGLDADDAVAQWQTVPHHDANGYLSRDLKYPDRPVALPERATADPQDWDRVQPLIAADYARWQARQLA